MIETLLDRITSITVIVVPALAEGFWRGLIVTLAGALIIPALRLKAATRHALWLALLVTVCGLPVFVGFFSITEISAIQNSATSTIQSLQVSNPIFHIPLYPAAALLYGTIFVSFIRLLHLGASCFSLLKLRKLSDEASPELQRLLYECISQKNLKRAVTIRTTSSLNSPALIGFFRPVILIPENLVVHLGAQELRQILSHEVAHLNRFDDWAMLLQRIFTSLFAFHPAVLWIAKQMNLEREIACDDSVIESGEIPRSYALCLTRLAEFASAFPPATAVSAGSQLSRRIDMLLDEKQTQRSAFSRIVMIAGMILIVGAAMWMGQEGSLLAVSAEKDHLKEQVVSDQSYEQGSAFESAQKRFEEARIKLEEAREEMLAAGEAMRSTQKESENQERHDFENRIRENVLTPRLNEKKLHEVERPMREVETRIRRTMKLTIPEIPVRPDVPLRPIAPLAEARPAVVPLPMATPPLPPQPESDPTPAPASLPELVPAPENPCIKPY